jgi:hypothetical protein
MDIAIILTIVLLWAGGIAAAIAGTADTFQFTPEVWTAAGYRRSRWVWQAALAVCVPAAYIYTGVYLVRVRPRLVAVERAIERTDPDYSIWVTHRRWFDRFARANRSPFAWAKAARLWWAWIPGAVVFSAIALVNLHGGTPHSRSPWVTYGLAALYSAVALSSAARAGFWYAERMRLTGRRPERGGPLIHTPTDAV